MERAGPWVAGGVPRGHRRTRRHVRSLDGDLDGQPELRQLLFEHACEASYGAPEYGGNHDLVGWRMIGYAGDVQPRGWSDAEVTGA